MMVAIDKDEASRANSTTTLLCWQCGAPLAEMTLETLTDSGIRVCSNCKTTTEYRDGIWCALSPQRVNHFRKFIVEYEFIRAAEGRGSTRSEY
jgi:hypothetical protein